MCVGYNGVIPGLALDKFRTVKLSPEVALASSGQIN